MPSQCPTDEQLQAFLTGTLDGATAEPLEQHLLGCESCVHRTRSLNASDPLIAALRTASSPATAGSESSSVIALMEQLKQHSWAETASNRNQTQLSIRLSDQQLAAEILADLDPPAIFGELGRLGDFRLQKLLGTGGMGAVFLAWEESLTRAVALKLLRRDQHLKADAKDRFLHEARSMAAIRHDHIVVIHQVGAFRGIPYIAEELLVGETLDQRLKREGRLPIEEVVRISLQISLGLAAAHERGVLHRDIKPSNIWLEAPRGRVKLLDFGLALPLLEVAQSTQTGLLIGTPAYMSPEQAKGNLLDERSDLFSLGVALYQMMTGDLPFSGANTRLMLQSLADDDPVDPLTLRSEIPPALAKCVLSLLAKDPTRRPATAQSVTQRLEDIDRTLAAESARRPNSLRRTPLVLWGLVFSTIAFVSSHGLWSALTLSDRDETIADSPPTSEPAATPHHLGASPFNRLDASAIPSSERYGWQPKGLVAVLGSHRLRGWHRCIAAEFLPNGRRCIVAEADGYPATLFDLSSGRILCRVAGNGGGRPCVDSRGDQIAIGTRIWQVQDDRLQPSLDLAPDAALDFTPDGGAMFVGEVTANHSITLRRRQIVPALSARGSGIAGCKSFAFAPDGITVAVAESDDQPVRIYDFSMDPPRKRLSLPQETGCVVTGDVELLRHHMTFDAYGRLVTIDAARTVRWWDIESEGVKLLKEVAEAPFSIPVCSSDGRALVVSGHGAEIWDLDDDLGIVRRRSIPFGVPRINHNLCDVSFSADSQYVLTTHRDGAVRHWGLERDSPEELTKSPLNASPDPAVMSPDGTRFAMAREDGQLSLWLLNGETFEEQTVSGLPQVSFEPIPLCFSPDNLWLVISHAYALFAWPIEPAGERRPQRWDLPNRPISACFENDRQSVLVALAEAPSQKSIWRGHWNGRGWSDFQPMDAEIHGFEALIASSGGTWFAGRFDRHSTSADALSTLPFWKRSEGQWERMKPLEVRRPTFPAVSIDGRLFAVGSPYRGVVLGQVDAHGPAESFSLATDNATCLCVAFSPDGRDLAAAVLAGDGKDAGTGRIHVWDLATRQRTNDIPMPGAVRQLFYSPDGTCLITINGNGTVYVMRLPT